MPGVVSRDLPEVRRALADWFAARLSARGVEASDLDIDVTSHTSGGYSNEILFADVSYRSPGRTSAERHRQRLVVRLPPDGPSLFPTYDFGMEAAVQAAVAAQGVPVPHPLDVELDDRWLGTPFLVMPFVDGHITGELPVADPWLSAATLDQQRALQERFLDTLAAIHLTPWSGRPFASHLRGADASLLDEVRWWHELAEWTFDGAPPPALTAALAWCRDRCPTDVLPSSLLWGDVRLGNVIFDDDFAPVAVLDWEMASIGPAELDLAWFTALEAMTEHFFGQRVPGFLTRDEIIARQELALGRSLVDLRWFEVFAMCRSTTLNLRADRLTAQRLGKPPRSTEGNALLAYTADAIASIS
ncbi:MAG: phosphotransferase family protein [Acidimicrobiales bacterium]